MLRSPVTREQLCVMLKRYHDLIYPPQLNKSQKIVENNSSKGA